MKSFNMKSFLLIFFFFFYRKSIINHDKWPSVKSTERNLNVFINDEILHGLLNISCNNVHSTIKLVECIIRERHLQELRIDKKQNVYDEEQSSFAITIPLNFIRNSNAGYKLFLDEFEKTSFEDAGLSIERFDDIFYFTLNQTHNQGRGKLFTATMSKSPLEMDTSSIDGLGILPLSPIFKPQDMIKINCSRMWLLVSMKNISSLHILFYSRIMSSFEKKQIVVSIRKSILECLERVNRLLLLSNLNETHVARYFISFT